MIRSRHGCFRDGASSASTRPRLVEPNGNCIEKYAAHLTGSAVAEMEMMMANNNSRENKKKNNETVIKTIPSQTVESQSGDDDNNKTQRKEGQVV
jgi:hypothetical protein